MQNALHQILQKISATGSQDAGMRGRELQKQIVELEGLLQKEKEEFEVSSYRNEFPKVMECQSDLVLTTSKQQHIIQLS